MLHAFFFLFVYVCLHARLYGGRDGSTHMQTLQHKYKSHNTNAKATSQIQKPQHNCKKDNPNAFFIATTEVSVHVSCENKDHFQICVQFINCPLFCKLCPLSCKLCACIHNFVLPQGFGLWFLYLC